MDSKMNSLSRREFLRVAAGRTAAASLVVPAFRCGSASLASVPQSRLERLRKGANVCRWFRFARNESAEHFGNYISESEAKLMRQMGLTHVRLCLQPKISMDPHTGAVREENAAFVCAAIERFHRAGLLVLVDLHNE